MDAREACSILRDCSYKPGHELIFRAMDPDTVGLEIWAVGLMDSDSRFAPAYRSRINRSDVYDLDVRSVTTKEQLWALVLSCILEWEAHETREFFSVNGNFDKPFHPHTTQGQFNWAAHMNHVDRVVSE